MTQAQHKAFSEACTRFGDELAKIFGTEAPKMDQEQDVVAMRMEVPPEVLEGIPTEDDIHDAVRCYLNANKCVKNMPSQGWEILEFRDTHGPNPASAKLKEYGVYYSEMAKTEFQLSQLLKDCDEGFITIHSVRRLSDNAVWKVGDKACYSTNGLQCEIQKFWLEGEKMMVETFGFISPIAELVEPRQPLFTTADGVEFFDDEDAIWVFFSATEKGSIEYRRYKDIDEMDWGMMGPKLYSTQEAAEKAYNKWLADQPVLSLNDIGFYDLGETNWNNLLDVVKNKITKR